MRPERVFTGIFGVGFPLVGVVLILIGAYLYMSYERARREGVLTSGTVVGMEEWHDEDGPMYAPVVRFTTTDGQVVEFSSSTRSRPAEYGPGDTVQVLYQPGAPRDAEIDTAFGRYAGPAVLVFVGAVLAVVGAGFAVAVNRMLFAGPAGGFPVAVPDPSPSAGVLEDGDRPRRPRRARLSVVSGRPAGRGGA
jgi:hypothetical protein